MAGDADLPGTGPTRASLVAVDADPAPRLIEEVARQAIRLEPAAAGDPLRPLVLLWLAPLAVQRLREVVEQVIARGGHLLLGCVPGGRDGDAERALVAGFDDVVVGRSSTRELAARLQALARRLRVLDADADADADAVVGFGRVSIDVGNHRVWVDRRALDVTPSEVLVIEALVAAQGKMRTRASLLDHLGSRGADERSDRAVDNVVMRLRRKLPDPGLIETVRTIGFRLRGR